MKISLRNGILVLSVVFSLAVGGFAQRVMGSQMAEYPVVTIPGSYVRTLESTHTGKSYDLYIKLPDGYDENDDQKYPVLYSLDGQWDFKLWEAIYGGLHYDGFAPSMILVGITYSGEDADYDTLRAMDYTPFVEPSVFGSGGAPEFLSFFQEELIPFVEENYMANPEQRILAGSSFGGTFTLYALFSDPELFRAYIAGSPVVVMGQSFAFTQEEEYAAEHDELPVRLYLAVGGAEQLRRPVEEFMAVMEARDYEGLELETRTIEGEGHAGNKPELYNRALRFVFELR
jgi:uncharacterized protein